MRGWCLLGVLISAIVVSPVGWAQDAQNPIVRVDVDPAAVNVGQALRLRVTVLVPTWFTKPPVYPNFELANAVTRLPDDSSFPTSERIGRDTWAGIVRDYQIYPQLAARYVMADQMVRVNYMNPDGFQATIVEVPVPAIAFQASVPSGAETLEPFLGGTQVTLDREIEGDLASLEAGDAIVMKVTAGIEGMPAMFLPSLIPQIDQPGMEIYAREPAVRDGKVATRVEVATVLFQGGGQFTLPPIELGWWNVRTQKVEVASAPALVIAVSGAPVVLGEETAGTAGFETSDWRWVAAGLVALGVGFAAPGGVRTARTGWRRWREAEHNSERYAFRALANSISSQDVPQIDRCLRVWLERLDPGITLEQLAVDSGVADLSTRLGQLTRARYGTDAVTGGGALWRKNLVELSRSLRNARSAYLSLRHRASAHQPLPPLNPTD